MMIRKEKKSVNTIFLKRKDGGYFETRKLCINRYRRNTNI